MHITDGKSAQGDCEDVRESSAGGPFFLSPAFRSVDSTLPSRTMPWFSKTTNP